MDRYRTSFPVSNFQLSAYYRRSNDELIVFVHGLGCSKDSFASAFSHPSLESFSLLAPDFIGFGDSSKPNSWDYTLEAQALVLAEVIKAARHETLHIAAHSFGGAVALLLPDELLKKAASFINIEGNLLPQDCGMVSRRSAAVPFEEFVSSVLPGLEAELPCGAGYFELDRGEPAAFHSCAQSLVQWSDSKILLEKFKNLPCPKLYVYGERSGDSEVLEKLGEIPKVEAPACGHFVTGDNPDWFFAHLGNFISGIKSKG